MTLAPIVVSSPFPDTDHDGIINFGKANQAAHGGVKQVTYFGRSPEGGFIYWPAGYNPPIPTGPLAPAAPVTTKSVDFGGAGRLTGWKLGAANGLHVTRAMNLITVESPFTGLRVADMKVDECREFITPANWNSKLYDARIERVDVGFHKRGMAVRGDSDIVINDARFLMLGNNTDSGENPAGLQLGWKNDPDDKVRATINRLEVGNVQSRHDGYEQGDGVLVEAGAAGITVTDLYAHDCCDGGVDVKAVNFRLDRALIERCFLGLKQWNPNHHGHVTIRNPQKWGSGHGKALTCLTLLGQTDPTRPPHEMVFDHLQLERGEGIDDIVSPKGRVHLVVRSSNIKKSEVRMSAATAKRVTLEWAA